MCIGVRPCASRVGRFLRNRQAFVYATNNPIAPGSDPAPMFQRARQHRVCGCSSLRELNVHRGQTQRFESRPISPKSASVCLCNKQHDRIGVRPRADVWMCTRSDPALTQLARQDVHRGQTPRFESRPISPKSASVCLCNKQHDRIGVRPHADVWMCSGSDPALTQLARQDVHRGQTPMGDD